MPSFGFFSSSRRKERGGRRVFSTSEPSTFESRSISPTPQPMPTHFPPFPRRGSEPSAPPSHGFQSPLPPIVLYNADGPSISGWVSAPMLSDDEARRRGSSMQMVAYERQEKGQLVSTLSPPRVPSPPLPPHPAVVSIAPSPTRVLAVRAASFNQVRPSARPLQTRPRSRSFGVQVAGRFLSPPAPGSPPAAPLPPFPLPSPRPRRPSTVLREDFPAPIELPSMMSFDFPNVANDRPLPLLDPIWAGFLEECQEDMDTLSALPNGSLYEPTPRRPSQESPRIPCPTRAASDPPSRPLPALPRPLPVIRTHHPATINCVNKDKALTPPHTPRFPSFQLPALSPLDALDASLNMKWDLRTAPSEGSLAAVSLSSAPSNGSMLSVQGVLHNSISLSAFPHPPPLHAGEQEAVEHAEFGIAEEELPYLGHLPTPPISPDSLTFVGKSGTVKMSPTAKMRSYSDSKALSFRKMVEQQSFFTSPERDYPMAREGLTPTSLARNLPYPPTFSRTPSCSSLSSSSDIESPPTMLSHSSGRSSRSATLRTVHSDTQNSSPSPRSSFEFDEPEQSETDKQTSQLNKMAMRLKFERTAFDPEMDNSDPNLITPMQNDRSPSLFHVGWSPAAGTVEYGYAV